MNIKNLGNAFNKFETNQGLISGAVRQTFLLFFTVKKNPLHIIRPLL